MSYICKDIKETVWGISYNSHNYTGDKQYENISYKRAVITNMITEIVQ